MVDFILSFIYGCSYMNLYTGQNSQNYKAKKKKGQFYSLINFLNA